MWLKHEIFLLKMMITCVIDIREDAWRHFHNKLVILHHHRLKRAGKILPPNPLTSLMARDKRSCLDFRRCTNTFYVPAWTVTMIRPHFYFLRWSWFRTIKIYVFIIKSLLELQCLMINLLMQDFFLVRKHYISVYCIY